MGTRDTSASIQIITLNNKIPLKESSFEGSLESDPDSEYIESYFEQYGVDNDCTISWSGVKLSENEGWHSLGGGSLFVKSRYGFNPFDPVREFRGDVEKIKHNVFTYNNGYKIGSKWDSGIYHIIFPHSYVPFKIHYPSSGDIEIVHCRVMGGRSIITYVFKKQLQLSIAMRKVDPYKTNISAEALYGLTVENMPAEIIARSEFFKDIKKGAINNLISSIPKLLDII